MASKHLLFHAAAREKVLHGAAALADAVQVSATVTVPAGTQPGEVLRLCAAMGCRISQAAASESSRE